MADQPSFEDGAEDLTPEERRIADALQRPAYPAFEAVEQTPAGGEAIQDDTTLGALQGAPGNSAPDPNDPLFIEPRPH